MGIPVLIMGESGSGKSTSMRNFEQSEIGIFNVASKPLPFQKQLYTVNGADYSNILRKLRDPKLKRYVIDDSQYLMAFELFDKAKETGYGKFTDIAVKFKELIDCVCRETPPDTIVYFLHHTEIDDTGRIKPKTIGKMLDNQLSLAGLFSIVLLTAVENGKYKFITQSDGMTTAKSPMGMFEIEIDNDLKFVDDTIRKYWNLGGIEE